MQPKVLVPGNECIKQFVQEPLHDPIEGVEGQVDAVIGEAVLRKIVGSDSFGTIAGTDHVLSFRAELRFFGGTLRRKDFRAQDGHAFFLVLVLGAFLFGLDDDTGRQVCDSDGGVGFIDMLTAGAAGAVGVDSQIFGADDEFIFGFGFRECGYGCGGGMDTSLRLGFGDTLDAVTASFVSKMVESAIALDEE